MADKNQSKKVYIWDGYGVGFWQVMTVLSVILLVLGSVTFVFAGLRILYGDRWFMWFILGGCGIAGIAFSIFCISLFPKWGTMVRRIRLAEARMEGAMSISEINRYEEREDRRSSEIKDRMTESLGRVGRDVLDTREKVDNLEARIQGMSTSLQSYIIKAVKDINASQGRDRKLDDMMTELDRMVGRRISDIDQVVKDLQTQMAFQNDILARSMVQNAQPVGEVPSRNDAPVEIQPEMNETDSDRTKEENPDMNGYEDEIPGIALDDNVIYTKDDEEEDEMDLEETEPAPYSDSVETDFDEDDDGKDDSDYF